MDDQRAQFLIMVGDACVAAGLASLPVQLLLRDQARVQGIPSPSAESDTSQEVDHTGYAQDLLIEGSRVSLEDVVAFEVRSP